MVVAAGCLYWDYKFHARALVEENRFSEFESKIKTIECPTVNKDVVLTIARRSVDLGHDFGYLFRGGAILFFGIGVLNFSLVVSHLRKANKGG